MPSRLLAALLLLPACNAAPSDLREWTPQDHHGEQRAPGQVAATAEADDEATLVEVTWRQNCAECHGLGGRGDTDRGQMLRVPDLTRAELKNVDDDALMNTIKKGRNRMPSFAALPDKVIAGLVRRIRRQ